MRHDEQVRGKVEILGPTDQIAICTITRGEILYGIEKLSQGKRRRNLETEAEKIFARMPCLSVSRTAGDRYAQIKREMERKGTPLDENDLWIVATALSMDAVLVSMDSDFQKVDSLRVENWSEK